MTKPASMSQGESKGQDLEGRADAEAAALDCVATSLDIMRFPSTSLTFRKTAMRGRASVPPVRESNSVSTRHRRAAQDPLYRRPNRGETSSSAREKRGRSERDSPSSDRASKSRPLRTSCNSSRS